MKAVAVIGVPTSAGSYAAGQDLAPAALRSAGLIEALVEAGLEVHDEGDLPEQVWRPDLERPLAQNLDAVVANLQDLAGRLEPAFRRGDKVLAIGGNCTIALGVVAALRAATGQPSALLYVDRGWDINTPLSTTDGALDWMGMGHALALDGAEPALVEAFGKPPLLTPEHVAWLGVEPDLATSWERDQASDLDLATVSSEALAADPTEAAIRSLAELPDAPLAVHFDVDVLDFTDAPYAENTDGRNTGPSLDQAVEALTVAASDPRFRALSVGELNPTRCAGDPDALPRFVRALVRICGAM